MNANLYLSADNISISFGERKLFDLERLRIYEGDRIGLVGMNGAGKTTLLRLLSGEVQPSGSSSTWNACASMKATGSAWSA